MKYAICNELYLGWPHEKAFAHASQCGYTGLEVAPFTLAQDIRSFSREDRTSFRMAAEAAGLQILGLHWLLAKTEGLHVTHPNPDVRAKTLDHLRELVRLCQDLGGNVMVFGSPPQRNLDDSTSYEEGEERFVELLKGLANELESRGVTLALEPLGPEEGNFMLTAESAIRVAERVASSHIKLHMDVKAMSTETKPIPQIIHESKDWMVHFHANDPNRQGPGMGDVDFVPIYEALQEINYDGWLSVEVFDYSPGIETLAEESISYLKATELAFAD